MMFRNGVSKSARQDRGVLGTCLRSQTKSVSEMEYCDCRHLLRMRASTIEIYNLSNLVSMGQCLYDWQMLWSSQETASGDL